MKEAGEGINGPDRCSGGANANACNGLPVFAGEKAGPDEFYNKLTKFYESSGFSYIFNFRETKVDLFLFYKCVTDRGGYCQVTKDGKWVEVASILSTKTGVLVPPNKIQLIYANLFYQFEQTYYYRTPAKGTEGQRLQFDPTDSGSGDSSSSSTGKRKHGEKDHIVAKRVCLKGSFQWPEVGTSEENNPILQMSSVEKNPVLQTPKKTKEMKKSSMIKETKSTPMGYRTGYMIFLRMECERLRMMHGEGSGGQYRVMASDAWRRLSKKEREPYLEASKKDKARYIREMAAYEQTYKENAEPQNVGTSTKSTPMINFARSNDPQSAGDYHVALPADIEHDLATNELVVDLTAGGTQSGRPNNPQIQINFDDLYESFDYKG